MESIIERTSKTVTVRMSTKRWKRIQQMEQAFQKQHKKEKPHYRHESLCGMFNTNATKTELVEEYLREKYHL